MSSKSPISSVDSPEEPNESIRMTISVTDPTAAQELLQCLGSTSENVSFSVDCVTDSGAHPCVITVDHLSEKQLEVVELAMKAGYYDEPRQATLSDLSDELGVSPSAVSQRLNAVEHKLVRALDQSCK